MKAIVRGDGRSRDRMDWAKMLGSCGWCSRVWVLGRETSPGSSQISGLGKSHYVGRDLEEEQIWKKDDRLSLERESLRA